MPRTFSNAEYSDIHLIYGFCNGNAARAVEEYRERFPNRRTPCARVFVAVHQRFAEFGFGRVRNENRRDVNRIQRRVNNQVIQLFDRNPNLSSRRAAFQLNIPSHTTVIADYLQVYGNLLTTDL